MKRIVFLLAFCLLAALSCAVNSWAQIRNLNPMLTPERLHTPDPYPLIEGAVFNWQKNFTQPEIYIDPGILLPAMKFDCDPGIFLTPKLTNCDPGIFWKPKTSQSQDRIPTFDIYTPPALLPSQPVSPFLLPGTDYLKKKQELRDGGRIYLEDPQGIDMLRK